MINFQTMIFVCLCLNDLTDRYSSVTLCLNPLVYTVVFCRHPDTFLQQLTFRTLGGKIKQNSDNSVWSIPNSELVYLTMLQDIMLQILSKCELVKLRFDFVEFDHFTAT